MSLNDEERITIVELEMEKAKNLKKINSNHFWLRAHFVKSSDKPTPPIPEKYSLLFQDFILNQKVMIGVVIPELKVRKRIAKYLYINP